AKMMAESAVQYPDFAAAFYAAGPATMLAKITGFLRSLHEHGLLQIDNAELAAEQLIASWLGLEPASAKPGHWEGRQPPHVARGLFGLGGVGPGHQFIDAGSRPQVDELGEHVGQPGQGIDRI